MWTITCWTLLSGFGSGVAEPRRSCSRRHPSTRLRGSSTPPPRTGPRPCGGGPAAGSCRRTLKSAVPRPHEIEHRVELVAHPGPDPDLLGCARPQVPDHDGVGGGLADLCVRPALADEGHRHREVGAPTPLVVTVVAVMVVVGAGRPAPTPRGRRHRSRSATRMRFMGLLPGRCHRVVDASTGTAGRGRAEGPRLADLHGRRRIHGSGHPSRSGTPPGPRPWSGGRDRRRSGDLALFRRALCQLSYPTSVPSSAGASEGRRANPDLSGPDEI